MSIIDAPFVGVAVPLDFSPISKAYWQTDASVKEIAFRFSLKSGQQVAKRAGKAVLRGMPCKHCGEDMIVCNRDHAIREIKAFSTHPKFNRIQCEVCFRRERNRLMMERLGVSPKKTKAPKRSGKLEAPIASVREEFYKSWEWRTLRMEALKEHGRACQCCGAEPGMKTAAGEPVRICVDHIKPISKYWGLRLEKTNLQVLCDECNMGKGNWDETDFRPSGLDEWIVEDQNEEIADQLRDWTTGRLLQ